MKISVVIPTYTHTTCLAACLRSFTAQSYPAGRFEVIVVNDGSPFPVRSVVDRFRHRLNVVLVEQRNAGPAAARNNGAGKASGQMVAFVDDDCWLHANWLSLIAREADRSPGALLGGRTVNVLTDNPFSSTSQLLVDYLYHYFETTPSPYRFFTSNNLCVPTDRFRKMGGFDRRMHLAAGEDREFCERWRQQKGEMVYLPEAIIYHQHQLQFASFLRQHFNYGRGARQYHILRKEKWDQELSLAPTTFYLNLLRYPWSSKSRRALRTTLLLLLAQSANTAGFLAEWLETNRPGRM